MRGYREEQQRASTEGKRLDRGARESGDSREVRERQRAREWEGDVRGVREERKRESRVEV